jgi:hypothetical protein
LSIRESTSLASTLTVPTSTWLLPRVRRADFLEHRVEFLAPRLVNEIVHVLADARAIRGNDGDSQLVNVVELVGLRLRRCRSCPRASRKGGNNSGS